MSLYGRSAKHSAKCIRHMHKPKGGFNGTLGSHLYLLLPTIMLALLVPAEDETFGVGVSVRSKLIH